MPRLRTLKPGFFTNEILAEIAPLGRLLFEGLWCLADREGRLEDRPKKIKAEILPYDDCDVDQLLEELDTKGFILRYEADGNLYIQVVNFLKHQNPHVKEAASTIPAPSIYKESTVQAPGEHSESTVLSVWDPDPDPDPGVGSGNGASTGPTPRTTVVDEPFIKKEVAKYADVFTEEEVRDMVRAAVAHPSYQRPKLTDKQAYVNNWLLKDAKPLRERAKRWGNNNGNGHQPEIQYFQAPDYEITPPAGRHSRPP